MDGQTDGTNCSDNERVYLIAMKTLKRKKNVLNKLFLSENCNMKVNEFNND